MRNRKNKYLTKDSYFFEERKKDRKKERVREKEREREREREREGRKFNVTL